MYLYSKHDKNTLFHHFKLRKVLVFIENYLFVQYLEEISAIIKKFPRPWVAWVARVARFSMSANMHMHDATYISSIT